MGNTEKGEMGKAWGMPLVLLPEEPRDEAAAYQTLLDRPHRC